MLAHTKALIDTRVLIVEDEVTLAENIMTHIQRCGGNVRIASTGKQAIAAAKDFQPQVILLDYHLPDMDGFEIIDAIHSADAASACVLMTGHPIETISHEAHRHEIDHILCKPFGLAEVEFSLVDAIGHHHPYIKTPATTPEGTQDRRLYERRAELQNTYFSIRLSDGSLLTHDRRAARRR